jgi:hypothetical protein
MTKRQAKRRVCDLLSGVIRSLSYGDPDFFTDEAGDPLSEDDQRRTEEALLEIESEMMNRGG